MTEVDRTCHACGGTMVLDERTVVGPLVLKTSFACEGCASTALVLGPLGYGALLGCAISCAIGAVYFALSKEEQGLLGALAMVALAAFFAFLGYLRLRDDRRNPPRSPGRAAPGS